MSKIFNEKESGLASKPVAESSYKMNLNPSLEELGFLQLLSLVLSILVLVGLAVEILIPLSPPAADLLDQIDFVVCLVFMTDFLVRFLKAPSKLEFMKWGWIDFLSSLPVIGVLQAGRIVRVLRVLRVLRIFRSTTTIWTYVSQNRPKATFKGAILLCVTSFILASVSILEFETPESANIKTSSDALWWSFSTMITVGCDKYPVTAAGRAIGSLLSLVGMGLMGVYTAYVASFFISAPSSSPDLAKVLAEIKKLNGQQ